MFSLNYIGSKNKLWNFIQKIIDKYKPFDTFGDLFSGTGIISKNISDTYHCKIISNDIQYYSYVINKANLGIYTEKDIELINVKINEYNKLQGKVGFISTEYSEPKRLYFKNSNAQKIDAIRQKIEDDNLPENIYYYILASLLCAADKIANTSCVYGSFLKQFKKASLNELLLKEFKNFENKIEHKCLNLDVKEVKEEIDVIYLDPPYNARQYYTNYHLLETIALYDNPEIYGKTGLRKEEEKKSTFCSKQKALTSLEYLLENLRYKILILSYGDYGIISVENIKKLFRKYGKLKIYKKKYKQFKANKNVKEKEIYEYLFVLKKQK